MLTYFIHALVSIFAVMNPLGITPTFLAMTHGFTPHEQRRTAAKAVVYSFFILLLFMILGNAILSLFSITIHAFRVAGGILLFTIAFDLLRAKPPTVQSPLGEEPRLRGDISMTPLALPIIAGPGTITTVMALSAAPDRLMAIVSVFVAFVLVLAFVYLIFYNGPWIIRHLSQAQLNVITQLMGFLLSIIAVQMAATGLAGLFPVLQ